MDAALLIGNGLNRCHMDKQLSWEVLMQEIAGKYSVDFHGNNSFPLEFECMANSICSKSRKTLDTVITDLKSDIAEKINSIAPKSTWIHRSFISLPVREIMTTNYDYYLENLIDKNFPEGWKLGRKAEKRERSHSIRRRYLNDGYTVRHIHGEANTPGSICLGYDHYVRALAEISAYIKEIVGIEYTLSKKPMPTDGMLQRSNGSQRYYGDSWMELFFTHDIHIVGLSLDVCEIDLWWLLTYRAKLISLFKEKERIKNTIYYYYTTSDSQKTPPTIDLFKRLYIECVPVVLKGKNYKAAYKDIAGIIKETISDRKNI